MNRRTARPSYLLLAGLLAAVLLAGCGDSGPSVITDIRDLDKPRGTFPADGPLWHRFGLEPPTGAGAPLLAWDLPDGWKHEATQMRPYNFVIEGDKETSAYLTALGKAQATLGDNVNRWRDQMGQPAIDQKAVDALPLKPLFGNDAIFVDVGGDFTGMMGGGDAKKDWHLLGLMFEAGQQHVFFKMTGPASTVVPQREKFLALAASFRREERTASPEAPARPEPPKPSRSKLTWTMPDGWTSKGRSGMREVTFQVEGTNAECWIVFIGGTGGGMLANVNRWLGEVGQKQLTEDEVAKLPRINVLGTQGVIVEGQGDYSGGMGGAAIKGALLYGLICPLAGRTLFVKMVGDADVMKGQRARFIAMCESLALEE